AEQIRVGEWVAENPLIGGTCEREHSPDESAEHDSRRAKLPEDGAVALGEARVHVQQRHVRECRAGDRGDAQVDRADQEADERRAQEEERRADDRQAGRGDHCFAATAFAPSATTRMKWTDRKSVRVGKEGRSRGWPCREKKRKQQSRKEEART